MRAGHFGHKTLQQHKIGTEMSGHFGTATEMSIGHFGPGAEVSYSVLVRG